MRWKPVRWSAAIVLVVSATALAGCSGNAAPSPAPAEAALRAGTLPEAVPTVPPGGAVEIAKQHFRAGNFGYAAQFFEQAIAMDRDNAEGWLGLAAAYDRLRRFDLADRAYAEVAGRAGRTAVYHNNIGFSYLLRGERAKARQSFLRALELAPESAVVMKNIELLERAEAGAAPGASSLSAG